MNLPALFHSAAKVLVAQSARQKYPTWEAAINATPATPSPPTTRADSAPHIVLRGPFQGQPDLLAVVFYIGVGLIEVRALNATDCTYETRVIDGDGVQERNAFLVAVRDLFFHDVTFKREAHA